ncbi:MAG: phosphotransferase [Porticoccus sp.]|mgnify:CR=1 FL=1|jgi:aminoglycoside/choline kinase family phosphotransferase|nr:phosphotransferase [Porticoccus sp.]
MTDLNLLKIWILGHLPSHVEISEPILLNQITSDAGSRQYFRVNSKPTLIAVLSPPSIEDNTAFVRLSKHLRENHLRVPTVYAVDYTAGFLIVEDFGDELLAAYFVGKSARKFYAAAEIELLKIQRIPKNKSIFPMYDRKLLLYEMNLFSDWFLRKLIKIDLSSKENQILNEAFSVIIESAIQQPHVVVHRDFHSRNLMKLQDNSIGVIDFQDSVIGPLTYDLISLYRDCYIKLPEDWVLKRSLDYYRNAINSGLATEVSDEKIISWLDLMGLQRHIKVLGIFSRLHLRDGKHNYLNDLPLVIRYVMQQLRPYPKLSDFFEWFERRVIPEASKQDWYKPWDTAGELEKNNHKERSK